MTSSPPFFLLFISLLFWSYEVSPDLLSPPPEICSCFGTPPALSLPSSPSTPFSLSTLSFNSERGYMDIAVCNTLDSGNQPGSDPSLSQGGNLNGGLLQGGAGFGGGGGLGFFPQEGSSQSGNSVSFNLGYDCNSFCGRRWNVLASGCTWDINSNNESVTSWEACPRRGQGGRCRDVKGGSCGTGERVEAVGNDDRLFDNKDDFANSCSVECNAALQPQRCTTFRMFFPRESQLGAMETTIQTSQGGTCRLGCLVGPTCETCSTTRGASCDVLDPLSIEKYVSELPTPPKAVPNGTIVYEGKTMKHYNINLVPTRKHFHPSLGPAIVYSYDGHSPGPLFDVERNEDIFVSWNNRLGFTHILPVDQSLLTPRQKIRATGVVSVTHLHGAHSLSQYDGLPQDYVPNGETYEAYYDNSEAATMLWYHDHALGITRLNAYAGLAGPYIVRDEIERSLDLPTGEYEIPLILQDRALCADGSLFYPDSPDNPYVDEGAFMKNFYNRSDPEAPYPSVIPEFFGNLIEVNGVLWPKKTVERKTYRFRTLVATNARTFILQLEDKDGNVIPMTLIGSDGGLLPEPERINSLRLMGAERADILIDFSDFSPGTELYLKNYGPDVPWNSDPAEEPADPETTGQVMKFYVEDSSQESIDLDWSDVPPRPNYCSETPAKVIQVRLYENYDEYGRNWLQLDNLTYMDPGAYEVPINEVVHWEFINFSEDAHPIHLHQIEFTVCDRTDRATGEVFPPFTRETGLKDTAECPPNYITRVAAVFDLPGQYVIHCHMLEHEDYDMMRPIVVS